MGYFATKETQSARFSARQSISPKTHTPDRQLHISGLRYYSPELGRWVNRDPIEEEGGINIYCAMENDPIMKWDILGERVCEGRCARQCREEGIALSQFHYHYPRFMRGDVSLDRMNEVRRRVLRARRAYARCLGRDEEGWYCRYGSASIGICLDVSSVAVTATGAGAPVGVSVFVLSIANNMISAKICGSYATSGASTALSAWGLSAINVRTAAGIAAADIALNMGSILLESF